MISAQYTAHYNTTLSENNLHSEPLPACLLLVTPKMANADSRDTRAQLHWDYRDICYRTSELLELARAGRYLQIIAAGSNFAQPLNLFVVLRNQNINDKQCGRNNKLSYIIHISVISGSLSPRNGASSGCGWRNDPRYAG